MKNKTNYKNKLRLFQSSLILGQSRPLTQLVDVQLTDTLSQCLSSVQRRCSEVQLFHWLNKQICALTSAAVCTVYTETIQKSFCQVGFSSNLHSMLRLY